MAEGIFESIQKGAHENQRISPLALEPLAERERQVLYLVRITQFQQRASPSMPELARILGVSDTRVKHIISALVRKGYLEWSQEKNWRHKKLLFPKGMTFPWKDSSQFPTDIF